MPVLPLFCLSALGVASFLVFVFLLLLLYREVYFHGKEKDDK